MGSFEIVSRVAIGGMSVHAGSDVVDGGMSVGTASRGS